MGSAPDLTCTAPSAARAYAVESLSLSFAISFTPLALGGAWTSDALDARRIVDNALSGVHRRGGRRPSMDARIFEASL